MFVSLTSIVALIAVSLLVLTAWVCKNVKTQWLRGKSKTTTRKRSPVSVKEQDTGLECPCKPPPCLRNHLPWGIDRVEQIFRANSESRLMELFLFHFRQTGWTLKQVFLGTPAFGTAEMENLESLMSTSFNDWGLGLRRNIMLPVLGEGIFVQDGEQWQHSRNILRSRFRIREYTSLDIFEPALHDLLAVLPPGGIVDLQPLFFRFTLDLTTSFLFGQSVQSLRGSAHTTFGEGFDLAQEYIAKRFRLAGFYWLIGGPRFWKACSSIHKFADQIIQASHSNTAEGPNFLRTLTGKAMDQDSVRGQIINILVAGRDTTACLLSWIFFLLARHPLVLETLRTEVRTHCRGHRLNRDKLRGMKYLQSVIKETLRLYPPVPVNTRTALRNTVLPKGGGPDRTAPVFIPKGSGVAFSVYAMHRRPDLYGIDAEIFRPERWEEEMPLHRDAHLSRWGYLPFHGGPRTCLGSDFASVAVAYTVVRIIDSFPVIKLPQNVHSEITGTEKQRMTLVLSPAEGCLVDLG